MRLFIFSLFLFCFSVQAEVVCKDPNDVGESASEADSPSSLCKKSVTSAPQGAVDRDINSDRHTAVLTAETTEGKRVTEEGDTTEEKSDSAPAGSVD